MSWACLADYIGKARRGISQLFKVMLKKCRKVVYSTRAYTCSTRNNELVREAAVGVSAGLLLPYPHRESHCRIYRGDCSGLVSSSWKV